MKRNIMIAACGLMLLAATSCSKKCIVCTENSGAENKYCSQNSGDRDDYAKVHTLLGQTCKEGI